LPHTLVAISHHADMLGGGEHAFFDLLRRLPSAWRTVALIPGKGDLEKKLNRCGIETLIVPLPAIRLRLMHRIAAGLKACAVVCRKVRPDVIYANGSRAALYAGPCGKLIRTPVVWHCRIAEKDRLLDPVLVRLCTRIIANSHATADRFPANHRCRIRVIYNGLDIDWLRDPAVQKPDFVDEGWKVVLVVARVSPSKRHDLVLSAFEAVARKNPAAHLVCVGDKDPAEPGWWSLVRRKASRSAFSSRIHWIGHVEDVRPWYRASTVLVLGSNNEGFGRVLVEAMASGVPVIAHKGGGIAEVVREGKDGILLESQDSRNLAEAILRVLQDEVLREALRRAGVLRAENFSLDRHIGAMQTVFEELKQGDFSKKMIGSRTPGGFSTR